MGSLADAHRQLSVSKQAWGLVAWLFVSYIAAAVGGIASANAGSFYEQLSRPGWAPPSSLFAPVWSVLYFLQGLAAWLVWRARGFNEARATLGLFMLQLAANALWTWLFFAWRQGAWAFAEILLLWILILATAAAFWRVRPWAGALLIPYLLWVSYALALTYSVWRRNPQFLG